MTDFHTQSGSISSIPTRAGGAAGVGVPRRIRVATSALIGATVFAVLTYVGANIRIPLYPVPVTLQTLFVILAGAILGARTGMFSQSIYVAVGVLGIPILAGTAAGLAVVSGPTAGYLAGFVVAAYIVGRLIDRKSSLMWHVTVFAIGSLTILVLGTFHLAAVYTHDLAAAFGVGFVPFIIGDAFKVLAAASIYRSYRRLRPRASL